VLTEPACYQRVKAGFSYQDLTKDEQKAFFAWMMRPKFLRMVGAHRASDYSFTLMSNRGEIEEGTFGHTASYWCQDCKGPCGEPEYHMTHRETWGYDGGQPEEGVNLCPACGSEECGDHDDPDLTLKLTNRYQIHRHPSYREAV
jgi:hypothetical protein